VVGNKNLLSYTTGWQLGAYW